MFFPILLPILVLLCVIGVSLIGNKWNLTALVSVSAGGLLALTFLDFLPHSFLENKTSIGGLILAGVLVQVIFEMYIARHLKFLDRFVSNKSSEHHHAHSHIVSSFTTCSVVGCLIICSFFDGIRFFAGLSIASSVGLLTGVGVFFHLLSEGVIVSLLGFRSGIKKRVILILSSSICISFTLGAFLAQTASHWLQEVYMQAFATGVLMYICFFHLLPISFEQKNRKWFIIGLILFSVPHFTMH